MTIHKLQQATSEVEHLQCLKEHIIQDWLENRDQIPQIMTTNWAFQDDIVVINRVIL